MGKGNRIRITKAQERVEKQKENEKQRRHQRRVKIAVGVLVPCVAIILIGAIVLGTMISAGMFLRTTVSVTSATYQIDNAMISYFYNTTVQDYVNNYSSSYFDSSKSLKTQYYSGTTSWFDFFMNSTKAQVQQMLILTEAAKADGYTLSAEDKTTIDQQISSVEQVAQMYGVSSNEYIGSIYGRGVTVDDVRRCLELSMLASSYFEHIYDGFTYTDEDMDTYYNDNKQSLQVYDYKTYTVKATYASDATEDVKAAAIADAKAKAAELAACTTPEAYDAWVKAYLEASGEEDAEKIEEAVAKTLVENAGYSESSDIAKWAFEEGRKAGDVKTVEGDENQTVVLLVKVPAREEYTTKNVRHILFTETTYGSADAALEKANAVLKEFTEGDAQTAEAFGVLAEKYTEDTGSASTGGQYTDIGKGEMVEPFEDWCFDEARVVGDTGVVKTDYGYHLMYFEGEGEIAWKVDAKQLLRSRDYEAFYTDCEGKYTVTFNDDNLKQIDG